MRKRLPPNYAEYVSILRIYGLRPLPFRIWIKLVN